MVAPNFWKKAIIIAIISFVLGGLVGLFFSKVFFLKPKETSIELLTAPTAFPTKGTEKLPTIGLQKIIAGEFTPVTETNASPKILAIRQGEEPVITVFDPQTEQTNRLPISAVCCGGSLHVGNLEPLSSYTRRRIAFIDKNDQNIWLVDSNGENKVRISNQGLVETKDVWGTGLYLSGWSGNEEWLIYHVEISDNGMGIDPKDKLQPSVIAGFYAANLKEGKIYYLPNLPNFVDFLPKSNSVVFIKDERDLYTRDLVTGEVKKLTQKSFEGTFAGQFSFSDDGHFAYTVGDPNLSFQKLIYTSLDNLESREIVKGRWAEVQFPKISPDGSLIAYEKYTPADCPSGGGGCPQASLVIYDLKSNQEKNLGPIKKLFSWFDGDRIVVLGGGYVGPWNLQLINRNTGEAKKIDEGEELRSW